MPTYSQAKRPMRIDTTLGGDVVLLAALTGEEGISTPFLYTLDLLSEDASIDAKKLLRSPATITLDLAGGSKRYIHGLIRRFVQLDRSETKLISYRAELVPWLWFLSLSSDCRIFQNHSVLDIVEQVFKAQGFSDFQIKCTKSYPKREFCVQYRETHLNFVSRLLEEEGIFYFFDHSKDKHVLVLADANSAVKPCPEQASARMAVQAGEWQEQDVVTSFEREHAVHTGKVTLRDWDYLQPPLQLESSISGDGKAEAYDYPGNYTKPDEGDRYARLRLEEQEAWLQVSHGAGVLAISSRSRSASSTNRSRFRLNRRMRGGSAEGPEKVLSVSAVPTKSPSSSGSSGGTSSWRTASDGRSSTITATSPRRRRNSAGSDSPARTTSASKTLYTCTIS